jgi:hypothetical protein
MSRFESITIKEVSSSDLETFYEHQLDPEAIRMAAFVGRDPKDKVAFDAHWDKILHSSQNITRTIVAEGQVAGQRAIRMEKTWKSPIGLEKSSGEED